MNESRKPMPRLGVSSRVFFGALLLLFSVGPACAEERGEAPVLETAPEPVAIALISGLGGRGWRERDGAEAPFERYAALRPGDVVGVVAGVEMVVVAMDGRRWAIEGGGRVKIEADRLKMLKVLEGKVRMLAPVPSWAG